MKPKALIIDDNLTCLTKNSILLTKYFDCDSTTKGFEGFIKFSRALKDNNPYDLIVLDIKMPQMDGIMVLKAIREIESLVKIPPQNEAKIIMVTASDENQDILTSFRSGCESYIIKPFSEQQLFQELEKLGFNEQIKAFI